MQTATTTYCQSWLMGSTVVTRPLGCRFRVRGVGVTRAYWINTFSIIHDEAKLAQYIELAGPAMRAAGGRFLARGEPAHAFESGTLARTTLIEFDSVDAAVAAYDSEQYQAALRALADGAERDIRIIQSLD